MWLSSKDFANKCAIVEQSKMEVLHRKINFRAFKKLETQVSLYYQLSFFFF